MRKLRTFLRFIQGIYYLITGIWPMLHMQSFIAVTGPKNDIWLVNTVGALIVVIALALLFSKPDHIYPEVLILGLGSALALFLVDVIYVLNGTISRIYLADALAESLLIAGWAIVLREYVAKR